MMSPASRTEARTPSRTGSPPRARPASWTAPRAPQRTSNRRYTSVRHFIIGIAWILCASGAALAEPAGDLTVARHHFGQGVSLYNDGDFNAALAEFEASYQSHASPAVLYNIGLTQKALFRYGEAVDTLRRYLTEGERVSSERRTEVSAVIAEMEALLAPVSLQLSPDGAALTVDGRTAGVAPLGAPLRLTAGHHTLELTARDHEPLRKEITVAAGTPLELRLALKAIPRTGVALLVVKPEHATVHIDDRVISDEGEGKPLEVELPTGGHQLEVTSVGFAPFRSELVIAPGQRRTLAITLQRPHERDARFYDHWWFWAIGVAVVGGATAAVAIPLTTGTASPRAGTLDPGAGGVN